MQGFIIKQAILEALKSLKDEEKRINICIGLISGISIIFLIFIFIYYVITSPLSALKTVVLSESDMIILENFKTETYINTSYINDGYSGDIPLFFQFDKRWANYPYAGTTIKIAGCGPTSLAMVVAGLTGRDDITPLSIAQYSTVNGFAVDGVGTSWGLMVAVAEEFDLSVEKISTTPESILRNLREEKVIIASMKPGTFTTGGHFIVLTGLTEDGRIKVNDSYSEKLSNMTFSAELISIECKGAWVYRLGEEDDE